MNKRQIAFAMTICLIMLMAAALASAERIEASPEYTDTTEEEIAPAASEHVVETVIKYVEVAKEIRVPEVVEVPVIVEKTEYVEVPCGVSERTKRYAGIEITPWIMELMARLAWREARGEGILGMRLVLEVVLNRVLSPHFPNTVYEVLYQPGQFAPYGGALELEDITPTEAQYEAVALVLSETPMTDEDVVFFATTPLYGEIWMHVGGHYFTHYPEE